MPPAAGDIRGVGFTRRHNRLAVIVVIRRAGNESAGAPSDDARLSLAIAGLAKKDRDGHSQNACYCIYPFHRSRTVINSSCWVSRWLRRQPLFSYDDPVEPAAGKAWAL